MILSHLSSTLTDSLKGNTSTYDNMWNESYYSLMIWLLYFSMNIYWEVFNFFLPFMYAFMINFGVFPASESSNESVLHIRWPKYLSFSFNIRPSNEHPGLISFRMDWLDILEVQRMIKKKKKKRVFSNTTVQKHQFLGTQFSLQSNSHIHARLLEKP